MQYMGRYMCIHIAILYVIVLYIHTKQTPLYIYMTQYSQLTTTITRGTQDDNKLMYTIVTVNLRVLGYKMHESSEQYPPQRCLEAKANKTRTDPPRDETEQYCKGILEKEASIH